MIRTVTTAQFTAIIMATVRHRRRYRSDRYILSQPGLAERAGWNEVLINGWETGRLVPTLRQALDCLEATV